MKMKIVVLSALLVCACTPVKTDLEKYALNCKAREVSLVSDTLELPYTVYFNSLGQADTVITYNFDGSFRYKESYTYNKRHQLLEINGVNAENENEARYEYDYSGRFISECRLYGMNNQEMSRWVHTNDGRHIVRTEYYNEGMLSFVTSKKYDGMTYVEESCTGDGELMGKVDVAFLTDDKFTRIKGDDIDVEIEYNDKALPVKCRGTFVNTRGELMWSSELDFHPECYYSYDYDERGNWIARYERYHPDSTATLVIRRTVKYQK